MNVVFALDDIVFVRRLGRKIVFGCSMKLVAFIRLLCYLCFHFVFSPHALNFSVSILLISNGSDIDMKRWTSFSRSKRRMLGHVRLLVLGFDKVVGLAVGNSGTVNTNTHLKLPRVISDCGMANSEGIVCCFAQCDEQDAKIPFQHCSEAADNSICSVDPLHRVRSSIEVD